MTSLAFLLFAAALVGANNVDLLQEDNGFLQEEDGPDFDLDSLTRGAALGHNSLPANPPGPLFDKGGFRPGSGSSSSSGQGFVQLLEDVRQTCRETGDEVRKLRREGEGGQGGLEGGGPFFTSPEGFGRSSGGSCSPSSWNRCGCISPATYTEDGRGNCNLGSTKMEQKVWCYVEAAAGHPTRVCPDAVQSKTKPGLFWSRFACIT